MVYWLGDLTKVEFLVRGTRLYGTRNHARRGHFWQLLTKERCLQCGNFDKRMYTRKMEKRSSFPCLPNPWAQLIDSLTAGWTTTDPNGSEVYRFETLAFWSAPNLPLTAHVRACNVIRGFSLVSVKCNSTSLSIFASRYGLYFVTDGIN